MGNRVEGTVNHDKLKIYGAKWAVLAAMQVDLMKRGAVVPGETIKALEMAHVKISSGCFSYCEADCDLCRIEGGLIACGTQFGEEYVDGWLVLMADAMAGELDSEKIYNIPALQPIRSQPGFLDCAC